MQLVALTALYLGTKVEEHPMRLRDVINCFHRVLHPARPPLRVGSEYDDLKASVVQFELILLRASSFDVSTEHPFSVSPFPCCSGRFSSPISDSQNYISYFVHLWALWMRCYSPQGCSLHKSRATFFC